jgi:membrane dipeptidase
LKLERIDRAVETIRNCPGTRLVSRASELASPSDDRIGALILLSGNNHTLDLSTVDTFFERGVRVVHPAMQYHNRYCTGIDGLPGPALSDFGRQVIARMNELGIVIDTAHASDESALAMIETSTRPVVDGHTTSRDLVPSSRGLSDRVLKRMAKKGGVVGVHFADHLLSEEAWRTKYGGSQAQGTGEGRIPRLWLYNAYILAWTRDPEERMRLRKNRQEQEAFFRKHGLPPEPETPPIRPVNVGHLADLVEYLVNLVGVEHVAIGGDVNGIDDHQWPEGMDHIGHLPRLTAELLRRGYKADALAKILSSNWLRVYRECLPE